MTVDLLVKFLDLTALGGMIPIAVILLVVDVMKEKLPWIHIIGTISLAVLDILLLADVAACIACLFTILF